MRVRYCSLLHSNEGTVLFPGLQKDQNPSPVPSRDTHDDVTGFCLVPSRDTHDDVTGYCLVPSREHMMSQGIVWYLVGYMCG